GPGGVDPRRACFREALAGVLSEISRLARQTCRRGVERAPAKANERLGSRRDLKSHTTERFRKALSEMPEDVRRQAKEAYKQFRQDPYHPSLHFKQVHPSRPIYSVRISTQYRAVGIRDGDDIIWFWI